MRISALMTVYSKELPEHLRLALESVAAQTRLPDEFVIVKDGPLGETLDDVIESFTTVLPITCIQLPQNVGRGAASKVGIDRCGGDIIARVDSDDLYVPQRFQWQEEILESRCDIDVVGGAIAEFETDPLKCSFVRKMPKGGRALKRVARFRSPVNNVTVMFRKDAVLRAGSYSTLRDLEDYHLWARMMINGSEFFNMDEVLAFVRAGQNMFRRRGGIHYAYNEFELQRYFLSIGFITPWIFVLKIILNSIVRVFPEAFRAFIYRHILRSRFREGMRSR